MDYMKKKLISKRSASNQLGNFIGALVFFFVTFVYLGGYNISHFVAGLFFEGESKFFRFFIGAGAGYTVAEFVEYMQRKKRKKQNKD